MQFWKYLVPALTLIGVVSSCRCFPPNPQQHYCNADFVLKVKILGKKHFGPNPNGEIRYRIQMLEIYKDSEAYESVVKNKFLWTTDNSASCGLRLDKKKVYVVSGFVSLTKLKVNSCQWYSKWKDITRVQKRGLEGKYAKECDHCKVLICSGCQGCFGKPCDELDSATPQPHLCLIRTDITPDFTCYYKFAICRKKDDKCAFTVSRKLQQCLDPFK